MSKEHTHYIFEKCKTILSERGMQYTRKENPDIVFQITSDFWNIYLKHTQLAGLSPKDVKMFMVLHKLAREISRHKEDNIIDAINYLVLYANTFMHEMKSIEDATVSTSFGDVVN